MEQLSSWQQEGVEETLYIGANRKQRALDQKQGQGLTWLSVSCFHQLGLYNLQEHTTIQKSSDQNTSTEVALHNQTMAEA